MRKKDKRQTYETTCDVCGRWMRVEFSEFEFKAKHGMMFICPNCLRDRNKKSKY